MSTASAGDAPAGANAYLLDKIAENGRTAEVTFYGVAADLSKRKMRVRRSSRTPLS